MAHAFLSDPWFDEVQKLRDEVGEIEQPPQLADLVINITVTGGPDGDRDVHMKAGDFELGHAEGAPTKLTVPYDTAKALIVTGDQAAAMQAFMSGQIKVEGDMTKIMAMQTAPPNPKQNELQAKIKEITE